MEQNNCDCEKQVKCPLGMAAVPKQTWSGELYDLKTALSCGTIFKELDLPFYLGVGGSCNGN